MKLLQIRDKLNEAQEAAIKAELILTETFEEFAINENLSSEELRNIFKPEVINDPKYSRIMRWINGSRQVSRKLDIVNDYLIISKMIIQGVDEELERFEMKTACGLPA